MLDLNTQVELLATDRLAVRRTPLATFPRPARRRTRLASGLRRMADRLEP